ncbi:MAG: TerC family protein [Chitinophagaceae bacterium]
MHELFTLNALLSLLTLTVLEIVLGVDNVIFVSIIMGRLDAKDQKKARQLWMLTGIAVRILLLLSLSWMVLHGDKELFALFGKSFNLRSLIMLAGGLFLLVKTVGEIHQKLEGDEHVSDTKKKGAKLFPTVLQIMAVDMVFSFDSIITAVGIAQHVEIMIIAVIIAMFVMFLFAPKIAAFVDKHPTVKMLALSFLVMVGMVLLIEGWDAERAHALHLKNYVYFAMAFSFAVELLNMQLRKRSAKPVDLHEPNLDESMK